jgi:hypothetical protein
VPAFLVVPSAGDHSNTRVHPTKVGSHVSGLMTSPQVEASGSSQRSPIGLKTWDMSRSAPIVFPNASQRPPVPLSFPVAASPGTLIARACPIRGGDVQSSGPRTPRMASYLQAFLWAPREDVRANRRTGSPQVVAKSRPGRGRDGDDPPSAVATEAEMSRLPAALVVGPPGLEPGTCGLRVWCEGAGQSL